MKRYCALLPLVTVCAIGCRSQHKIDMTHEVKPIHITIDINVKIDRALDNFFDDIDETDSSAATKQ